MTTGERHQTLKPVFCAVSEANISHSILLLWSQDIKRLCTSSTKSHLSKVSLICYSWKAAATGTQTLRGRLCPHQANSELVQPRSAWSRPLLHSHSWRSPGTALLYQTQQVNLMSKPNKPLNQCQTAATRVIWHQGGIYRNRWEGGFDSAQFNSIYIASNHNNSHLKVLRP